MPSPEVEARNLLPSSFNRKGQKLMAVTVPVCFVKTATGEPVCNSQTRITRSHEPAFN